MQTHCVWYYEVHSIISPPIAGLTKKHRQRKFLVKKAGI